MKTIRASEIGLYLYCQRAWWYMRQGVEPENQAELSSGTEMHQRHGSTVMWSGCLRILAYLLLLLAIALLAYYLVSHFLL